MKKAMLLILSLMMCLCLSACGSSDSKPEPQKPDTDTPEVQPGTEPDTAEDIVHGNDECGYITINMYHNILKPGTNGSGIVQIFASI